MKKHLCFGFVGLITLLIMGCKPTHSIDKETYKNLQDGIYANIVTNKGSMLATLFYKQTPMTVANFVGLSEGVIENKAKPKGLAFYNGLSFHRVIKDFMIQGGDPKGNGQGDPGYRFADEFVSELKHDKPGVLSMANAGPGTNGSQFFITHKATPWLDGRHSVFGKLVKGFDALDSLAKTPTDKQDRPKTPLIITKIEIIRKGKEAQQFQAGEIFVEQQQIQERRIQKALLEQQVEEKAFLESVKKLEKQATVTKTGLKYVLKSKGQGNYFSKGNKATVHYTLRLSNGKKIDSSYDRKEPINFVVGEKKVIKAWDEAFMIMPRGSKFLLIAPPHLAYGSQGAGADIPPNETLYFDIEILE